MILAYIRLPPPPRLTAGEQVAFNEFCILLTSGAMDSREHDHKAGQKTKYYCYICENTKVDLDRHGATWRFTLGIIASLKNDCQYALISNAVLEKQWPATLYRLCHPISASLLLSTSLHSTLIGFVFSDGPRGMHEVARFK